MNIILPIHPKHVKNILDGNKIVEVRRVCPKKLNLGDKVLIYSTVPVKQVIGSFTVTNIIEQPINELWRSTKSSVCIEHTEFDKYFKGKTKGCGIFFCNALPFPNPITLEQIGIQAPPQGFQYIERYQYEQYE